ncbi:30S ribosomal protein S20 [candidate division WOR-3 bacterium JGI_Cruoil_03_51_56]|uniref:Small ribosomal subunit protein bS20 n=1 Tax=candidate division WOR-3 bacterium JGI_Cruoil_03_51_56 TaxID=1973747 RepID=A0A235BRD5_UNCW3|nr:MAG: 30S ribosomal protein S20 [candidate division WOR-3 bacterium JGI_Cruoil_03_51_56]
MLCPGTLEAIRGGILANKSLSVLKRARQNERRRLRNRERKNSLKQAVKEIRAAGSKDDAKKLLPKVQSVIDRSARHHIIHRNTGRRLKARISREVAEAD